MSTLFAELPVARLTADASERTAALDVTQSFIVEAPAGSGKTGLLVQRMLKLLCRVERPESVLALTFTNKATAEMRERVLRALDLVARDPSSLSDFDRLTRDFAVTLLEHDRRLGWNIQANAHRLNIRTIDSLCGEIARSLPLSSGAVGQMEPVEDAGALYRRAARAVMLRLGGEDEVLNDALRTVLLHQDADLRRCEHLLADMLGTREQWGNLVPLSRGELEDDYLETVVKPKLDGALQSVICATLRKLESAFPAPELQTLTEFAVELSAAEGYQGETNPVAACAQLRAAPGSDAVHAKHWSMLAGLLLNASKPFGWRKSFAKNHLGLAIDRKQKARLEELIESVRAHDGLHALLCSLRDLPPSTMPEADWRVSKALFHLLRHALVELQLLFQEQAVCDFTERSLAARSALRSGEARDALGNTPGMRLEHLLVDEMQDTSSAQYELLEALTSGWDGHSQTLFLVGDPKQSIYLFRQARVERFLESLRTGRLGHLCLTVLRLSSNFRSAAPLVDRFNQLFEPVFAAPSSGGVTYSPANAAAVREGGRLRWQVDAPLGDHNSAERSADRLRIRREQAEDIVKTIFDLRSMPTTPSIAVLVRSREHAAMITRKLKEAAIPFRGVDLERLNERPEVLDTIALTRALLHPADRVAWLAVLRAPWCGATLAELHQLAAGEQMGSHRRALRAVFREHLADLPAAAKTRIRRTLDVLDQAVEHLGRMPLAELIERTGRALGADLFRDERAQTNVRRCLELIEAAEAELKPLDADDLQTRLAQLYAEPDTTPGAVEVMTIHKAKGLEWDVVFVPELQRTSGRSDQRLLDWMELAEPDAEGRPQVVLAPIAPRGTKAAELGRFVQAARKRQEEAEIARLLYVVVTRARTDLHLYAAPALKKHEDAVVTISGTLLCAAWPGSGAEVQHQATAQAAARVVAVPSIRAEAEEAIASAAADYSERKRVPASFDPERLRQPLLLPWMHSNADADADTGALEVVHRPEGALASRALGTAVHLLLEELARQMAVGPERDRDRMLAVVSTWQPRVRAVLRSMALHGSTLEQQTLAAMQALTNTLGSTEGLWLLQPHRMAASEQAITLSGDDALMRVRLDRTFYAGTVPGGPANDTLWIVEYKTATPNEDEPREVFLERERERYAPQLRNYARARLQTLERGERVMLALFYPMVPCLDCWSFDPEETG